MVAERAQQLLNGHVSVHVTDIVHLTAVTMNKSVCRWADTPTETIDQVKALENRML